MAHTLEKTHGKATHALWIGTPRSVADSAAFTTLDPLARALYFDLRRQHNGRNNGDICAADGNLEQYGWSHSTIAKYLKQIVEHGLMIKTRQGGIGALSRTPTLYGFTDAPIVANPAKGIAGSMPSLAYRNFEPLPPKPKRVREKKSKVHAVPMKVHAVHF